MTPPARPPARPPGRPATPGGAAAQDPLALQFLNELGIIDQFAQNRAASQRTGSTCFLLSMRPLAARAWPRWQKTLGWVARA